MGAREGRVETHRHARRNAARWSLSALVEAVHVPKAAVIGLPRIERVRRLAGWRGCARPSRSRSRSTRRSGCRSRRARASASSSFRSKVSAQTMRAVRASTSSTPTTMRLPGAAPSRWRRSRRSSMRPASSGPIAAFAQREDRALRDDEHAPQLGETGDDVMGQAIGEAAARAGRSRPIRRTASPRSTRGGARSRRRRPEIGEGRGRAGGRRRPVARSPAAASRACATPRGAARRPDPRPRRAWRSPRGAPRPRGCGRAEPARRAGSRAPAGRMERARAISPDTSSTSSESAGRLRTRCSSTAAWQARNRRRCATSQPLNCGIALDLQPVEEIADEQLRRASRSRSGAKLLRCRPARRRRSRSHRRSSRRGRARSLSPGRDPSAARLVEHAPDLRQAPAELAARVVRHVPQELAELAAPDGAERQREIGEQRTRLARGRQRLRDTVPAHGQRPEQTHDQAGVGGRRTQSNGIHVRFHAGSHARPHGKALSNRSTRLRQPSADFRPIDTTAASSGQSGESGTSASPQGNQQLRAAAVSGSAP